MVEGMMAERRGRMTRSQNLLQCIYIYDVISWHSSPFIIALTADVTSVVFWLSIVRTRASSTVPLSPCSYSPWSDASSSTARYASPGVGRARDGYGPLDAAAAALAPRAPRFIVFFVSFVAFFAFFAFFVQFLVQFDAFRPPLDSGPGVLPACRTLPQDTGCG
jgi:hypothetical protein